MVKKVFSVLKKDIMLAVAILAAIISLFIHFPTKQTWMDMDWKTLATLYMLLVILDGFKSHNLFMPLIRLSGHVKTQLGLSLFLVYGVFVSSMFVTNDVSLIIFVPLTIFLFRACEMEDKLLSVIVLENVAAIRGSLLTPFGSPQNLFLFSQSGMTATDFIKMMLPLFCMSAVLLYLFLLSVFRKNKKASAVVPQEAAGAWEKENRGKRIMYFTLFGLVIIMIVTRTALWPWIALLVTGILLIFDRKVFARVDYALLGTFFCFFLFASAVAANEKVAGLLREFVGGHEYWWSIGLSQVISNVPAGLVLWPFSDSIKPLIYGLDTAGLVSIIGSLASIIAMRIYLKEYPGRAGAFMLTFEKLSLLFFAIVTPLQLLILM